MSFSHCKMLMKILINKQQKSKVQVQRINKKIKKQVIQTFSKDWLQNIPQL